MPKFKAALKSHYSKMAWTQVQIEDGEQEVIQVLGEQRWSDLEDGEEDSSAAPIDEEMTEEQSAPVPHQADSGQGDEAAAQCQGAHPVEVDWRTQASSEQPYGMPMENDGSARSSTWLAEHEPQNEGQDELDPINFCGHPCSWCSVPPCVREPNHEGFLPPCESCECARAVSGVDCYHRPPRRAKFLARTKSKHKDEKWDFILAPGAFEDSGPDDAFESVPDSAEVDDDATAIYRPEWDPNASVSGSDLANIGDLIDYEAAASGSASEPIRAILPELVPHARENLDLWTLDPWAVDIAVPITPPPTPPPALQDDRGGQRRCRGGGSGSWRYQPSSDEHDVQSMASK